MRTNSIFILLLYCIAILAPSFLAFSLQPTEEAGFIAEAGMLAGMIGIMIVFFQFVISARIKWIDRLYGYNNVIDFHRRMGVVAFGFILLHLSLVTLAEQKWDMLLYIDIPWYINLGKITFLILLTQVATSIFRKKTDLSYERWKTIHDWFAVSILILMFVHSFFAGGDLEMLPLQVIWFVLPPVGLALFLWQRFFLFKFAREYTITEVIEEADNVHTIHFTPVDGQKPIDHKPGQFHFIKFTDCAQLRNEEHPFTISSSPSQKSHLASTIKASGDFTNHIHLLQKGDKTRIVGPYGKLSFVEKSHTGPIIFIAGGIGVTPFMSMIQYMVELNHQREVILLYFNRTEADIAFRNKLNEFTTGSSLKLKVVHILSKQEDWNGEKGHFNKQLIEKYCVHPFVDHHFYVCGPPAMSQAVLKGLNDSGIPKKNIYSEMFGLAQSGTPDTYQKKKIRLLARCIVALLLILLTFMAGIRSDWKMFSKESHGNHEANISRTE